MSLILTRRNLLRGISAVATAPLVPSLLAVPKKELITTPPIVRVPSSITEWDAIVIETIETSYVDRPDGLWFNEEDTSPLERFHIDMDVERFGIGQDNFIPGQITTTISARGWCDLRMQELLINQEPIEFSYVSNGYCFKGKFILTSFRVDWNAV